MPPLTTIQSIQSAVVNYTNNKTAAAALINNTIGIGAAANLKILCQPDAVKKLAKHIPEARAAKIIEATAESFSWEVISIALTRLDQKMIEGNVRSPSTMFGILCGDAAGNLKDQRRRATPQNWGGVELSDGSVLTRW